jgi:curli biogenesis system outer membrane secretion channel CsgG
MKNITIRKLRTSFAIMAAAVTLSACISPTPGSDGRYANPIGSAPVISNETPYSHALRCLGTYARAGSFAVPRVAVGRISDYTGKVEFEGGRQVTQGAALMAISAMSKAGARLVERYDISVSELELKYANNRLIGDDDNRDFRRIIAGSIPGSDLYLVGGITELNYNIRSGGIDGFGGSAAATGLKGTFSAKLFVMDVGLDLRLVDTRTLEVVDVISYQKQILGREIRAGIFDFFNGNIVDIGVGERSLEPVQMAVRAVIERGVLEMMARLYGVGPEACTNFGTRGDPLGGFGPRTRTVQKDEEHRTFEERSEPYRWQASHRQTDGVTSGGGLRGSYR